MFAPRVIRKPGESQYEYAARVNAAWRDPWSESSKGREEPPMSSRAKAVGIGVLAGVFFFIGLAHIVGGGVVVLFLLIQVARRKVARDTGYIWIACAAVGSLLGLYMEYSQAEEQRYIEARQAEEESRDRRDELWRHFNLRP